MLCKVVSGAQSGADLAALEVAKKFGYETGGVMPFGYKTLEGFKPQYKEMYGLTAHSSSSYVPRTRRNVQDSDGTIRFAYNFESRGEICTLKAIEYYKKPHIDVDLNDLLPILTVTNWISCHRIEVLNIAGNSEQTSPGTHKATTIYLEKLFQALKDDKNAEIDSQTTDDKTLVIMRGLPWSGKSYRAKELAGSSGLIFSTDDYWYQENYPDKPEEYSFNPRFLAYAHKWNQLRAQRAIDMGEKLIVIDNTNTVASEFCCGYAKYAHFQDYKICIEEPTSERWLEIREILKNKRANKKLLKNWAVTLAEGSKGIHNVPFFAIERMMWRWENNLDPDFILNNCKELHTF